LKNFSGKDGSALWKKIGPYTYEHRALHDISGSRQATTAIGYRPIKLVDTFEKNTDLELFV